MTGKVHLTIGISASIGISALFLHKNHDLLEMGLFVCMTAGGSLIPDADHPNSTITTRFPHISKWLYRFYCAAANSFGEPETLNAMYSHRGICHSLSACLSTIFLFSFYLFMKVPGTFIIWGIILGMLLHIVADSFTPAGTMLLAPFSLNKYINSLKRKSTHATYAAPASLHISHSIILYIINLFLSLSSVLYFITFICVLAGIIEAITGNFLPDQFLAYIFLFFLITLNVGLRLLRKKIYLLHTDHEMN